MEHPSTKQLLILQEKFDLQLATPIAGRREGMQRVAFQRQLSLSMQRLHSDMIQFESSIEKGSQQTRSQ